MKKSKTIGGYKRKQNKRANQNREQKRDIRSQEITTMIGLNIYFCVVFLRTHKKIVSYNEIMRRE